MSDQGDAERQHDGTDPYLSTDGSELAVLDGDDSPDGHNCRHDRYEQEHCQPSFHIGTDAALPVNLVLVTRQNRIYAIQASSPG